MEKYMKELIEDMFQYLKTGNKQDLLRGEYLVGGDVASFHVMVIDVLSWLNWDINEN